MRARPALVPALLVLGLLGACGEREPATVEPHGLALERPGAEAGDAGGAPAATSHGLDLDATPSAGEPRGEPIAVRPPLPGARLATLQVRVEAAVGDVPASTGRARLEILERVRAADAEAPGSVRLDVHMRVVAAEGVAQMRVRGMDGARFTVALDEAGRPVEGTRRWHAAVPLATRDFVTRLWMGGYAGAPSWLPPRPVRVGERWSLDELDVPDAAEALAARAAGAGVAFPAARREGGVTVAGVGRGEAGPSLRLVLATLLTSEGPVTNGALSLGLKTEGEAVIEVATGHVLAWTCEERLRLNVVQGDRRQRNAFAVTVEGRVREATAEEAERLEAPAREEEPPPR